MEGDLELPLALRFEAPGHLEAQILEHVQHAVVRGHDESEEALDALSAGILRETLQHGGADAVALLRVENRKSDLGALGVA